MSYGADCLGLTDGPQRYCTECGVFHGDKPPVINRDWVWQPENVKEKPNV
jgi:hypothetical protein